MHVYKLLTPDQMAAFARDGAMPLAPVDEADGYVHLSSATQVAGTAARHFADHRRLWLVAAEARRLGAALRWEPSRGDDLFPHFHGRISEGQILWARPLARDDDGAFVFPPGIVR